MDDYSDLPDEELELLLSERAEALEGELVMERTEDGDWMATIKRDGESLVGYETAFRSDALIGLLDEMGG